MIDQKLQILGKTRKGVTVLRGMGSFWFRRDAGRAVGLCAADASVPNRARTL